MMPIPNKNGVKKMIVVFDTKMCNEPEVKAKCRYWEWQAEGQEVAYVKTFDGNCYVCTGGHSKVLVDTIKRDNGIPQTIDTNSEALFLKISERIGSGGLL